MDNEEKIKEYEEHKTPVPSYDELQNMNKAVNECMSANIKLVEQNTKLKELLKEAEKVIWEVMDCREDREFYRDLADEYYAKRSKMK